MATTVHTGWREVIPGRRKPCRNCPDCTQTGRYKHDPAQSWRCACDCHSDAVVQLHAHRSWCAACGGDGWLPNLPEGESTCPACQGTGKSDPIR